MGFDSIPVPDRSGESREVVDYDYVTVSVDQEAIESKVALALAELIEYLNTTSEELRFVDAYIAQLVEKYAGDDEEVGVLLSDRLRDCQETNETGNNKMSLRLNMADPEEGGPELADFMKLVEEVQQILGVSFFYTCPEQTPTQAEKEMQEKLDQIRAQWGQMRGF